MLPVLGAALAEFDEPKRSTFVMFGVLTIAVRIYHDRWGYGVYSGPIGTAVLAITVKWVCREGHHTGDLGDACGGEHHFFRQNTSSQQAAFVINARFDQSEQSTTSPVPTF